MNAAAVPTSPRPNPLVPVPLVLDADVLVRNIGYAVRNGHHESLISRARHAYTRSLGIPLYATTSVAREVERHLPEIAERCEKPFSEVHAIWNDVFRPRILFVPVQGNELADPRIEQVRALHANDVPTATLAILLAEAALLTHNIKHFRPLGVRADDAKEISVGAHTLGTVLDQASGATTLTRLVGVGTFEGGKRVKNALGSDLTLLVALLALGAVVLYWDSETVRKIRIGAAQFAREIGPPIADAVALAEEASASLWSLTVKPMDGTSALPYIARELALTGTLTTSEIADRLLAQNLRFRVNDDHAKLTRAWLTKTPCFYELQRGHWSLGYEIREYRLS